MNDMNNDPTIATYDTYASVYDDEVIDFWQHFPVTVLDAFRQAVPGTKVVDVGSGSGRDAVLLRDRGLDVTCVDASKTMIGMTQALGFVSKQLDFAHMDFPANSFDGVWAYTSLIHIPKEQAATALRQLHDMLRPQGALLFGAIEGKEAKMVERSTMPDAMRYFKFYTAAELKELVTGCGFEFISEENYQPHSSVYLNQLYRRR